MKADGSHQRRVTAAHLGITELAWSPDGRRMALTLHDQSNGHVGLAVMNADGSGFRRLFWEREPASYDNPVWAADGRIFFARSDNSELREISSVKPDGSGLTVVSAAGRADSFSLSHDGKWLLIFDSEQRFAVRMAADGRGGEQVVLGKDQWEKYLAGAKGWPIASSWSPEGRWVAVAASAVQTMGLVSSGLWVVKSDSYSRPFLLSGAGMKVFDPAWQPR
jgi:Tol biopolymer transport system component